jgi:large subunit ribosomal protein L22
MEVKAQLNYLRIAPRKVRSIADMIRGKTVEQAQNILRFTIKKGVDPMIGLLKSATTSATNNFHLLESNLYISKITVNEGPKLKRSRPRARGSAFEIQKKTSHITIILDEKEKGLKKAQDGQTSGKKQKEISDKSENSENEGNKEIKKKTRTIDRGVKKEINKTKAAAVARKSFIRRKAI